MEKLYYCRESEKLWTLEELKRFFETESDGKFDGETFGEWLNKCMYYNNGTLEEIKILYTVGTMTVWNIYTEV